MSDSNGANSFPILNQSGEFVLLQENVGSGKTAEEGTETDAGLLVDNVATTGVSNAQFGRGETVTTKYQR